MSRIKYELFGLRAEISSCELSGSELQLIFPEGTEGFVRIGAHIYKLANAKATLPLCDLDDGILTPHLFVSFGEITLPLMEKAGRLIKIMPPSPEDTRETALRALRLERELSDMQKKLDELKDYVRGTTIF